MKRTIFLILALILSTSATAQSQSEKPLDVRSNYAVIVGINDYMYDNKDMTDLDFCEADALAMYDTLKKYCHYSPDQIFLFLDGKNDPNYAKKADLITLERLFDSFSDKQLYPNVDTLIFYFSGHGGEFTYHSNELKMDVKINLLVPVDGTNDAAYIETHNLRLQNLIDKLSNSNFKRQVMFIDACRLPSGEKGKPGGSKGFKENVFKYGTGMKVLYGTSPSESSWEYPEVGHGLFTYFLLAALQGKAPSTEGVMTFDDVEKYTFNQMAAYSRDHPSRKQIPFPDGKGSSLIPITLTPYENDNNDDSYHNTPQSLWIRNLTIELLDRGDYEYELITPGIDIEISGDIDAIDKNKIGGLWIIANQYGKGTHEVNPSALKGLPRNIEIVSSKPATVKFRAYYNTEFYKADVSYRKQNFKKFSYRMLTKECTIEAEAGPAALRHMKQYLHHLGVDVSNITKPGIYELDIELDRQDLDYRKYIKSIKPSKAKIEVRAKN